MEIESKQRDIVLKRKMEENSMLLQKRHKMEGARPAAAGKDRCGFGDAHVCGAF